MLGSPRAPFLHNRLLYLNSVLRAERSAAALRFARNTGGMGETGGRALPLEIRAGIILIASSCKSS